MGLPLAMEYTAVPSGPSSWRGTDGTDFGALSIMQIIEKKQGIEAELRELSRVLASVCSSWSLRGLVLTRLQHKVDMSTPLTTPDGFPRADLDVAQSTIYPSQ